MVAQKESKTSGMMPIVLPTNKLCETGCFATSHRMCLGNGRKAWGAESGVHGWTFKEKQELRHGAAILANHLIKQVRMTSECAQDVHSLHVTSVESQNPFLGTLAPMAPAAVPFPTISSGTRNIAGTG